MGEVRDMLQADKLWVNGLQLVIKAQTSTCKLHVIGRWHRFGYPYSRNLF
jgi:hypothetical protein